MINTKYTCYNLFISQNRNYIQDVSFGKSIIPSPTDTQRRIGTTVFKSIIGCNLASVLQTLVPIKSSFALSPEILSSLEALSYVAAMDFIGYTINKIGLSGDIKNWISKGVKEEEILKRTEDFLKSSPNILSYSLHEKLPEKLYNKVLKNTKV